MLLLFFRKSQDSKKEVKLLLDKHRSALDSLFDQNISLFFLISHQKYMLWISLEAPGQSTSNENAQHIFLWSNI